LKVNVSKSRPTVTFGVPGFRVTWYAGNAYRITLGISGTGLFWSWWWYDGGFSKVPPPIQPSILTKVMQHINEEQNHG